MQQRRTDANGLAGLDPCMKQGNPDQVNLYLQWLVGCGQA